jgi:hypothetical protein
MTEPISNTIVFGTTAGLIVLWIGAWQWLKFLAKGKK